MFEKKHFLTYEFRVWEDYQPNEDSNNKKDANNWNVWFPVSTATDKLYFFCPIYCTSLL